MRFWRDVGVPVSSSQPSGGRLPTRRRERTPVRSGGDATTRPASCRAFVRAFATRVPKIVPELRFDRPRAPRRRGRARARRETSSRSSTSRTVTGARSDRCRTCVRGCRGARRRRRPAFAAARRCRARRPSIRGPTVRRPRPDTPNPTRPGRGGPAFPSARAVLPAHGVVSRSPLATGTPGSDASDASSSRSTSWATRRLRSTNQSRPAAKSWTISTRRPFARSVARNPSGASSSRTRTSSVPLGTWRRTCSAVMLGRFAASARERSTGATTPVRTISDSARACSAVRGLETGMGNSFSSACRRIRAGTFERDATASPKEGQSIGRTRCGRSVLRHAATCSRCRRVHVPTPFRRRHGVERFPSTRDHPYSCHPHGDPIARTFSSRREHALDPVRGPAFPDRPFETRMSR